MRDYPRDIRPCMVFPDDSTFLNTSLPAGSDSTAAIPTVEDARTEFKRDASSGDIERKVVAFLNSPAGGRLFVGVDETGRVVGVPDPDAAQLAVKNRLRDNVRPSCLGLFDVRLLRDPSGEAVVCVDVAHGLEGPYYLKKFGRCPAGCFVRVGSGVEPMTEEQIETAWARRLRNSLGRIVSPRQDLVFSQLKIYYESKGADLNDEFRRNLELLAEDGRFNYAAYLLADSNGNSVKFAKYAGTDRVDLVENEEFGHVCLVKSFHELETRLRGENKTFARITPTVRQERSMVDPVALREAVLNALLHNDYSYGGTPKIEWFSDRVEIVSCGGLPAGLTREGLLAGRSVPRNKELMRVFRDLGLVESLGSGVRRILRAYPETVIDTSDPNFFVVILRFADDFAKGGTKPEKGGLKQGRQKEGGLKTESLGQSTNPSVLPPHEKGGLKPEKGGLKPFEKGGLKRTKGGLKTATRDQWEKLDGVHLRIKIAEVLEKKNGMTIQALAEEVGKARSAVAKHLARLRRAGIVRYVGPKRGGHWEVSRIPDASPKPKDQC